MTDFEAEPFDESNPTLRSLQSGLVASPELSKTSIWHYKMVKLSGNHLARTGVHQDQDSTGIRDEILQVRR